jgi:hypothetical protein
MGFDYFRMERKLLVQGEKGKETEVEENKGGGNKTEGIGT